MRLLAQPVFELDLWGGVERRRQPRASRVSKILRRQFASQLLGLVLGSGPGSTTHSSTLLWEKGKEGPIAIAHPTPWLYPLHLCTYNPRSQTRESSLLPSLSPDSLPGPAMLVQQPQQEATPTPSFPAPLSPVGRAFSGVGLSRLGLALQPKSQKALRSCLFSCSVSQVKGNVEGKVVVREA